MTPVDIGSTILAVCVLSVQVVAPMSCLWLACDHCRLLMASGHQAPTDTEVTTALGAFDVRSSQLPELRR